MLTARQGTGKYDRRFHPWYTRPTTHARTLLTERITQCTACPRLVTYRQAIAAEKRKQFESWPYWGRPVPGFGDPHARLYVLGLAPAAHGGNRTGRVFTGDRSGDWLYDALHRFGFANQATLEEFMACRPHLREEIRLLQNIRVVVALGKIAFDHYLKVCRGEGLQLPSPLPKFSHGIVEVLPWGTILIGSYHPSQQNTFTGRLTRSMFNHIFATARQRLAAPEHTPADKDQQGHIR